MLEEVITYFGSFFESEDTPRQKNQAAVRNVERGIKKLERESSRYEDDEVVLMNKLKERARTGVPRSALVAMAVDLERSRCGVCFTCLLFVTHVPKSDAVCVAGTTCP